MNITQLIPQIQKVTAWQPDQTASLAGIPHSVCMPCADARLTDALHAYIPSVSANAQAGDACWQLAPEGATALPCHAPQDAHDFYAMQLSAAGLFITAATAPAFFYAIGRLRQLQLADGSFPYFALEDWADVKIRSDYIEFRNFYPKLQNVSQYIAQMAERHINHLIIELENRRPFFMNPAFQSTRAFFTQEEIKAIQACAKANFIDLIPLQQTFGHIEYILQHKEYEALREVPTSPAEICPSNPESVKLAVALVQDIAKLFPESRYLHIGCDEVWNLCVCDTCKQRGLSKEALVIEYVNQIAQAVCDLGKTPILWHDMLLHATSAEIANLDKRIVVALWLYDQNDMVFRAEKMMKLFVENGVTVWGGCAVRAFDGGALQNYPHAFNRRRNVLNWVTVAKKYHLQGMINTNWSAVSALASPYGVYETSIYTNYFAAECLWNQNSDTASFLLRYLLQYHGVTDTSILEQGWQFEDYYQILPLFEPFATKNTALIGLMKAVQKYELAAKLNPPVSGQLFRVQQYANDYAEWESFFDKYETTYTLLAQAKQALAEQLPLFLEQHLVDDYIAARFVLWDLLEKEIIAKKESPAYLQLVKQRGEQA